jgi:hypothetical protein
MDGTRTADAENAYKIGEAFREAANGWLSGPLAVVVAGHYYDFMRFLQRLLVRSMQEPQNQELEWLRFEIAQVIITNVPLIAEVELFEANGHTLSDDIDVHVYHQRTGWKRHTELIPRKDRFLLRFIRHGRTLLSDIEYSDTLPYMADAWRRRNEDVNFDLPLLRQSSDLLQLILMAATNANASPEAMWRAARAIMWEWAALIDYDFIPSSRSEIAALEGLLDWRHHEESSIPSDPVNR